MHLIEYFKHYIIRISLLAMIGLVMITALFLYGTTSEKQETGLLFHLSADNGFTADYAQGNPEPAFLNDIEIIQDGAKGKAFRHPHFTQLLAYDAPGNLYAERGTFSFFWRPRDPVGKTPFHIIQAGPSDHSDLVMTWMRIDYNGEGGYDAFVTDANLACIRASYKSETLPQADKWHHIAFTWDENVGVRLFVNGKFVAQKDTVTVLYQGLDRFGVGGRGVTPHFYGSEGNFFRSGDFDEYRIYDRMLDTRQIAYLAKGKGTSGLKPFIRNLEDPVHLDNWWLRYGWNRSGDVPPLLTVKKTVVRKVEIHDTYDLKQWWWKGNDGIRETTWPAIYNRSRIPGRTDYIIQPDWNCYSLSGKKVTFSLPDEPWNHVEIAGAAFGKALHISYEKESKRSVENVIFSRPEHQERTFHRISDSIQGGKIRFENEIQETPIGEFMVYNVTPGKAPEGITTLMYRIDADAAPDNPSLTPLIDYINGRFPPDERAIAVALPPGQKKNPYKNKPENQLPLVHILIPFEFRQAELPVVFLGWYHSASNYRSYTWENIYGGLDGIEVNLSALNIKPTHDNCIPLNIRIMDPLWSDRTMIDFTFSVKPGEERTLFLDTRDRILPNSYPIYLTIAGSSGDFGLDDLNDTQIRLIFKDYEESRMEHEADRFIQLKDNAGFMVEPGANVKKHRIYERFSRDITDLLRVNPHHEPGREYWYWRNPEQSWPSVKLSDPPPGVPLWAWRQVQYLKLVKQYIIWWIDNRQIENGEFGGGLSDDGDMTHQWVGPALMGVDPDKLTDSVLREMDAFYDNGMFTDGLPTIQTDELHTYEEGIQVLPQCMALAYGDPKTIERMMETAKSYERITGINSAGHRHIRSNFFSATKIAEEGIWQYSYPFSYLILHAGLSLVEFNGNPTAKKLLLEVADGLLEHRRKDDNGRYIIPAIIHFPTDEDRVPVIGEAIHLFWAAWRWTGDEKYLLPIEDMGIRSYSYLNSNLLDFLEKRKTWGNQTATRTTPHNGSSLYRHIAWQMTGNKQYLENYYADQIQTAKRFMYINTEGHFWVDRVNMRSQELQRSRLGGIGGARNTLYPGHTVSWRFKAPADDGSVAILVPDSRLDSFTVIACNLERDSVEAEMTVWDITPGTWEVTEGIDRDGDDTPDNRVSKRIVNLQKSGHMKIVFTPRSTTIMQFKLKTTSIPQWECPDLGIGSYDISISGNNIDVTVHSLGSVDTPTAELALVGSDGIEIANATIPALEAPFDLKARTTKVRITVPPDRMLDGCSLVIDHGNRIREITKLNNIVKLGDVGK